MAFLGTHDKMVSFSAHTLLVSTPFWKLGLSMQNFMGSCVQRTGLPVNSESKDTCRLDSQATPLVHPTLALGLWNFTHQFYLAIAANNENITSREFSPEVL